MQINDAYVYILRIRSRKFNLGIDEIPQRCQKFDFADFYNFSLNSKDNHGGSSCGGGIRICIRFFKKVKETLLDGAK